LFLQTLKKFTRMLKCNIAIRKSFIAECVDISRMRRYLIQIYCTREESSNILTYRFNIQSYSVTCTLPSH
jgi:hypothetical protein